MVERISINFVLDKEDFAFRSWPAVPRVGDYVTLRPKGQPTTYRALLVLWNVRENGRGITSPEVDIHITEEVAGLEQNT